LFGYRASDGLHKVEFDTDHVRLDVFRGFYADGDRLDVATNLGCPVRGASPLIPDNKDPETLAFGNTKRCLFTMPEADPELLQELKEFNLMLCRVLLTPLSPDADFSVESWLDLTNYSQKEKLEILEACKDLAIGVVPQDVSNKYKIFMKWETYAKFKFSRCIFYREAVYKALFGPICKMIEHIVYEIRQPAVDAPYFIKHVPVESRPEVVEEAMAGLDFYVCSDFSSFEQTFKEEIMHALDDPMFDYMLEGFLPESWIRYLQKNLSEVHSMRHKYYRFNRRAQRASGEMNTSLSNGWGNLVATLFLYHKMGIDWREVIIFVEGDDRVSAHKSRLYPTNEMFRKIGFLCEQVETDDLGKTSFVGMLYSKVDRKILADPLKHLMKVGWCDSIYLHSRPTLKETLLRSRGYSLVHMFNGCPILGALGNYVLRVTRKHLDVRGIAQSKAYNTYERSQMLRHITKPLPQVHVGMESRLLVDELFGIGVEAQIRTEEYLDSLDSICELDMPWLEFPMDNQFMYFVYTARSNTKAPIYYPRYWEPDFGRVHFDEPQVLLIKP